MAKRYQPIILRGANMDWTKQHLQRYSVKKYIFEIFWDWNLYFWGITPTRWIYNWVFLIIFFWLSLNYSSKQNQIVIQVCLATGGLSVNGLIILASQNALFNLPCKESAIVDVALTICNCKSVTSLYECNSFFYF